MCKQASCGTGCGQMLNVYSTVHRENVPWPCDRRGVLPHLPCHLATTRRNGPLCRCSTNRCLGVYLCQFHPDKSYFIMSSKRPHSPKLLFFSLQYEFIKRGFQETEHVVGEHAKPCFSKTFHIALVQTVEPAMTIVLTVSTLLIMWEHS